jgi:hypothetical protein
LVISDPPYAKLVLDGQKPPVGQNLKRGNVALVRWGAAVAAVHGMAEQFDVLAVQGFGMSGVKYDREYV